MKNQLPSEKRREFLTKVCPTVAFAMFGLSFLEACSSGDTGNVSVVGGEGDDPANPNTGGGTSSGFTINGNQVVVDLANQNFANLADVGGNTNISSAGVLLLRVSESQILAFDNCCPHEGQRNSWSYNGNNTFTCSAHNNTFSTNEGTEVSCESGATGGKLVSYETNIVNNTLTIEKS